jgi:hypothetical protein
LLAIEKKPIWDETTHTFVAKETLPISISADNRIFDSLVPIPQMLTEAFQEAFKKMQRKEQVTDLKQEDYQKRISAMADDLLGIKESADSRMTLRESYTKARIMKGVNRVFGEDLEHYGAQLTPDTHFKNRADHLLLGNLGFDADTAQNNAQLAKIIDKMLAEDLELGYYVLHYLQTSWVDYIDTEALFNTIYKKIANSRLGQLEKLLAKGLLQGKVFS